MRSRALTPVLRAFSWVASALGALLLALAAVGALLPAGPRSLLLPLVELASALVPEAVLGLFVLPTPFGGALRGDFAVVALVLLAAGWALRRLASPR